MGERPAEAADRFHAARTLVDVGRIPDGLEMLEGSLRFRRRVGGRYIKAAERLMMRTVGSDETGDVVNGEPGVTRAQRVAATRAA
jgi:hypothetical protein